MTECKQLSNVAKYADTSEACKHLPLDANFKNSFQDVRGGSRKRKLRRNQKAGSVNYVLKS